MFQAYLRLISGISQVYLRQILGIWRPLQEHTWLHRFWCGFLNTSVFSHKSPLLHAIWFFLAIRCNKVLWPRLGELLSGHHGYHGGSPEDYCRTDPIVCWVSRLKRKHDVKSLILSTQYTWSSGMSWARSPAKSWWGAARLWWGYRAWAPPGTRSQRTPATRTGRRRRS